MHLLVTGGAGFIGSNFVHYLLNEEANHQITTLDALTYAGRRSNLEGILSHPDHKFIEGDIRDRELVETLLEKVDVVVNFAAETHVDRSIDSAEPFVSTNVQGTQTLLDAAIKTDIEKFIQISTDEVYGEVLTGEFSEKDPLNPRNPYAATKASADLLAHSYYVTYDIPVVITRSSNNFGPRQYPEKLIPKFIKRAAQGKSLPVYGDGSNVREWTYVMDNCRAINLILSKGNTGEIYNIGSGQERQNINIAHQIIDAVGASENLIEFVEDRPGHDQRYALDTEKIESLGWEAKYSFENGLSRTIEYYL